MLKNIRACPEKVAETHYKACFALSYLLFSNAALTLLVTPDDKITLLYPINVRFSVSFAINSASAVILCFPIFVFGNAITC